MIKTHFPGMKSNRSDELKEVVTEESRSKDKKSPDGDGARL